MRLLLDTHVWIWMISAPERLEAELRDLLLDDGTEVFLSIAAVWELAIKHAAGKLRFAGDPGREIPVHLRRSGVAVLGISVEQCLAAAALPMHHRDPFDRLMIAQAVDRELTLVTADARLAAYDASLMVVSG